MSGLGLGYVLKREKFDRLLLNMIRSVGVENRVQPRTLDIPDEGSFKWNFDFFQSRLA